MGERRDGANDIRLAESDADIVAGDDAGDGRATEIHDHRVIGRADRFNPCTEYPLGRGVEVEARRRKARLFVDELRFEDFPLDDLALRSGERDHAVDHRLRGHLDCPPPEAGVIGELAGGEIGPGERVFPGADAAPRIRVPVIDMPGERDNVGPRGEVGQKIGGRRALTAGLRKEHLDDDGTDGRLRGRRGVLRGRRGVNARGAENE